jgi:DNA-directed RNA polymerase specialized sigma24 family protein
MFLKNPILAAEVGEQACFELVLLCARDAAPLHPASWIRTIVRRLGCKMLGQPRAKETVFTERTAGEIRRPHELRTHVLADEWAYRRELLRMLEPRLLAELTDLQAHVFRQLCAGYSVKQVAKQLRTGPKDVRDVRRVVVKKAHQILKGLDPPPSPPFEQGDASRGEAPTA